MGLFSRFKRKAPVEVRYIRPTDYVRGKPHWCGRCGKGFNSEQDYMDHKCNGRSLLRPTEGMEALK